MWDKAVLQHSHSNVVIKHAASALGALHKESYLRRTNFDAATLCTDLALESSMATQEYTSAVTQLRRCLENGTASLTVVLICAALFTHFEFLNGSFTSGVMHKSNSVRLLELAMQSDLESIDRSLVHTICRIDLQASLLSCVHVPMHSMFDFSTPDRLVSDPTEARILVTKWTRRFYRFIRTSIPEQRLGLQKPESNNSKATSLTFVDAFRTIEELLEQYMASTNLKLCLQEQQSMVLLQIRVKINRLMADVCSSNEMMYDECMDDFESILTSISYVMQTSDIQKLVFSASFDEGLLQPLDFVATKCRNSVIRHRALDLMKRFPSHAGMWHVAAMIKSAERVVQFEESEEASMLEGFLQLKTKRILNNHVLSFNPADPGNGMRIILIIWPTSATGASAEIKEELKW